MGKTIYLTLCFAYNRSALFQCFRAQTGYGRNICGSDSEVYQTASASKRSVINGNGQQSRDFTYIENVIEANLKACLTPKEADGEVFNIAYGGRGFLNDIYLVLTKTLNVDIEPSYGLDCKGDTKDISKARELLEYDPEWSFVRGIAAAIEWYKEHL